MHLLEVCYHNVIKLTCVYCLQRSSCRVFPLIHLIGQLRVSFGAKLVQECVPTRSSIGIQRGRPHVSTRPLFTGNLTLLTESKARPESSCSTSRVRTVTDLCQVQEVCENDELSGVEGVRSKNWPGTTEAQPLSSDGNNTSLYFEFKNGAASHNSGCVEQDEVTSDSCACTSVSKSDSALLHVGNERNDEIAVRHYALYDLTDAGSKPSVNADIVLSNSDSNLLQLCVTDSALKHHSASFEMPTLSSPSMPLSSSVPDLSQSYENGKSRKHDGFTPTKLKSKVLGWKTDCGAIISSLPNLFSARNSPKQSRYKHISKPKESEEKPMLKEEIVLMPKSPCVTKPANQNCEERLAAVDTRSGGAVEMHSAWPQEEAEATEEPALYGIQWSFPEPRKRSYNHIAKFALSCSLNDDKKQVPHQSRPRSSPAYLCKFLQQQLCVHCQHIVMLPCLVRPLAFWLCLPHQEAWD